MDNTEITQAWDAKRDALIARMKAVQAAIQAETGTLDLTVYRARLEESGLAAEWEALQQEPGAHKDIVTRKGLR